MKSKKIIKKYHLNLIPCINNIISSRKLSCYDYSQIGTTDYNSLVGIFNTLIMIKFYSYEYFLFLKLPNFIICMCIYYLN